MEKLEFVDSHVHFYDMRHPELFYGHWQPDVNPPLIGKQMRKLRRAQLPRRGLHRDHARVQCCEGGACASRYRLEGPSERDRMA